MANNRQTGSRYESVAADYLVKQGYRILERNFYSKQGEIDLVAQDGRYLVFVEVKYRSGTACGSPAEAVGPLKQRRIRGTARYYLYSHGLPEGTPCRFDVVAITGGQIELIRDAF